MYFSDVEKPRQVFDHRGELHPGVLGAGSHVRPLGPRRPPPPLCCEPPLVDGNHGASDVLASCHLVMNITLLGFTDCRLNS